MEEKIREIVDRYTERGNGSDHMINELCDLFNVSQQRELTLDLLCEIKKASLAIPMSNEKEIRLRSIIKSIYSG